MAGGSDMAHGSGAPSARGGGEPLRPNDRRQEVRRHGVVTYFDAADCSGTNSIVEIVSGSDAGLEERSGGQVDLALARQMTLERERRVRARSRQAELRC